MAISLDSIIRGLKDRPPRVILLGVEKVGKSTFASQWESPIFAPIRGEEGIDSIDVPQFPTIQSYDQLMEAIGVLYQEDHTYKTFVVDSSSTLESLVWAKTCQAAGVESIEKVGGGFGKGYIESMTYWRLLLEGLDALRSEKNMAIILIGHVKVKQFNDPTCDPYDQYQWDINERAANAMYRWADLILFAAKKIAAKSKDTGFNKTVTHAIAIGDESVCYTKKRPAHPGGGRGIYGKLPYQIPLTYAAFQQELQNLNF